MQKQKSTAGILKRCLAGFLSVATLAAGGLFMNPIKADAASSDVLSNSERGVIYANSRTDFRDESIYFVITTRFYDGDPSNNARTSEDDNKAHNPEDDPSWRGDFKGLIDKLDYIKALGFTAIWITPVVENDSGYDYHGYHAYNFSAVDTRYESNGITYQDLIDACHAKGMKIIQDVVLNHTCNWGEKNLLQIDDPVYAGGRSDYVMPSGASKDPENIYHHNGFCGGPDWDNYSAQNKTIADDCFDLETENPKVYNYLVDCYTNYINMGVDAFRIDTMRHISRLTYSSVFAPAFRKAGGDDFYMFGEVCTKGHDVWYRDQPPISCAFYTWGDDESWTSRWSNDLATNEALVEQHYVEHNNSGNQPTSDNAFLNGNEYHTPDYSQKSGMDVIDFQMHWSFINANSAFNTALGEDKYFNDSTWNVVYVDSHDYAPDECQTVRYTGGTDAWAENLSLMFTFRGIPCIYYGSEVEFQKGKPIDVGPNSPLSETGRAYFGDHIEGTVDTKDFTVFGNVSGEVQNTLNSTLSQHIMRLNRIRQAIPALRKGQYSTEGCSGNMAFKRRYTDSNTDSFVCVAISGNATFTGVPNGKYVDAVTGDVQNVSGGTLTANVSGKGNMKVYVLDTAKTPAPGRVITNGDYLTDGGAAELIGSEPIEDVPVTGISVSKSSVSILEGKSETVTATVTPSNASNKTVTWTSSNPTVATVAGGKITGISAGSATITAKTSNGLTATVSVKVSENPDIVKPTGVTVSPTTATVEAGSTTTLTATVAPSNATDKTVTWTSSNTAVATVSGGVVKGVAEGTAVITATTSNGKTATATITVTGKSMPYLDGDGVYFEKPSGWGSNINVYFFSNNQTVGASWPGTAMKDLGDGIYGYEYDTTDSNLMVIFNDGSNQTDNLKYVKNGYYNSSGYVKTVEKVIEVKPTGITLNKTSFELDLTTQTEQLTATITPANATNKTVTWTSSDTSVATVSNGLVIPKSVGIATITATTSNGLTATAQVSVVDYFVDTLVNNSTISSTSINKGESVTMTAKATGGATPYTYTYFCKSPTSSSYTTLSTTTATTYTHKPANTGTYSYAVKVVDTLGNKDVKYFTVNVSAADLANNSTISATSITKGSSITMTAKATGGTTPYTYTYFCKSPTSSSYTTLSTTTATTYTHKPANTGTYSYAVKVVDKAGNKQVKYFTVKVNAPATPLANNSTISATSITKGTTITLTAKATGGTAPYKYKYYCKPSTDLDWTALTGTTTATSYKHTPARAISYQYAVKIADSEGKTSTKYFTVKVSAALTNSSTISATTITKGSSITMTAKATGGTTPYTYTYFCKSPTSSSYTTLKTTTATTYTHKPANTGTYSYAVKVVDNAGNKQVKYFTVKVNAASTTLTNASTISATSITKGTTITLTAKATGGTSPYKYRYFCKPEGDSDWTALTETTTATSFKHTPARSISYQYAVKVADSTGKVVTKYFTVSVK